MKGMTVENKNQVLVGTSFETALAKVGHTLLRTEDNLEYVLMVLFDRTGRSAVALVKQKGPAHLIGKITFPGGRLNLDESLEVACSREMLEEAGLTVPTAAWQFVSNTGNLAVFAAAIDDISEAKTMETEPVFVVDYIEQIHHQMKHPELFPPDYSEIFKAAHLVLNFK